MKKIILAALVVLATPAFAEDPYYAEYVSPGARDNYVGVRLHKNEHISYAFDARNGSGTALKDDNVGFGVYVGNRLTHFLKLEFETMYTGTKDTQHDLGLDFDIWSNMVNVHLYKSYENAVEPYVGLGLGFTTIWSGINGWGYTSSDSTFDFSYAIMAGINFALNDRVDLNLGFKYQKYGDADHTTSGVTFATTDIDVTEFYLGAAYKFDIK